MLLRRVEGIRGAGLLAPPGGGILDGEDPIGASLREGKEETGLDFRLTGLMAIITVPHESGGNRVGFVFRGLIVGGEMKYQEEEVVGHEFVTREEAGGILVAELSGTKTLFRPQFNVLNIADWIADKSYPLEVLRRFAKKAP